MDKFDQAGLLICLSPLYGLAQHYTQMQPCVCTSICNTLALYSRCVLPCVQCIALVRAWRHACDAAHVQDAPMHHGHALALHTAICQCKATVGNVRWLHARNSHACLYVYDNNFLTAVAATAMNACHTHAHVSPPRWLSRSRGRCRRTVTSTHPALRSSQCACPSQTSRRASWPTSCEASTVRLRLMLAML